MKNLTADEAAEKQINRLSAATADISRGIDRVTESPTAKAADRADKMLAGVTEAVKSGKWAQRLRAVGLNDWKAKTKAKVDRVASGAAEAKAKIVAFHSQLREANEGIQAKLSGMDDSTPSARDQRMLFQIREMRKFRFMPPATT